jgi:hypothetical protein
VSFCEETGYKKFLISSGILSIMNSEERRRIIAESPISFIYLKRFNIAAGVLHLIQGLLMLVLGTQLEWERSVYTFYPKFTIIEGPPFLIEINPDPQVLLTIGYLGVIVASFPLISALAHFVIAFAKNEQYNENLKKGMNPYRWYEYAFSSSIMIVLIALFLGVWDKLVSLHSRKHFRLHTLGCALCILCCSYPIHGSGPSNLRLHDTVHLLLHVQHLRSKHDSAV